MYTYTRSVYLYVCTQTCIHPHTYKTWYNSDQSFPNTSDSVLFSISHYQEDGYRQLFVIYFHWLYFPEKSLHRTAASCYPTPQPFRFTSLPSSSVPLLCLSLGIYNWQHRHGQSCGQILGTVGTHHQVEEEEGRQCALSSVWPFPFHTFLFTNCLELCFPPLSGLN